MLCSKLHCKKGFDLMLFSCKVTVTKAAGEWRDLLDKNAPFSVSLLAPLALSRSFSLDLSHKLTLSPTQSHPLALSCTNTHCLSHKHTLSRTQRGRGVTCWTRTRLSPRAFTSSPPTASPRYMPISLYIYMVHGMWYVIRGIWCMVYSIWHMVSGIWYLV